MQAVILLGIILLICIVTMVFFWKKTRSGKRISNGSCKSPVKTESSPNIKVIDDKEIDLLIEEINSL